MRSIVLSISVCAASVAWGESLLLVGATPASRALVNECVAPLRSEKISVKIAGPSAPATACLELAKSERAICLGLAATGGQVTAALLVEGHSSRGSVNASLELIATDGQSIGIEKLRTPLQAFGLQATAAAQALLREYARRVSVTSSSISAIVPTPADVPRAVEPVAESPLSAKPVDPQPLVDGALVASAQPGNPMKVAAWSTTSIAGASAVGAGVFAILGAMNQAQIDQAKDGTLSYAQAQRIATTANADYSIALGLGITSAVTGIVAAALWSQVP